MFVEERVAVVLDVENLVGPPPTPWPTGLHGALQPILESRAVVSAVGYCAKPLQKHVAFELADLGIRVFGHRSAEADAADHLLLDHLAADLPHSTTTVILGSG